MTTVKNAVWYNDACMDAFVNRQCKIRSASYYICAGKKGETNSPFSEDADSDRWLPINERPHRKHYPIELGDVLWDEANILYPFVRELLGEPPCRYNLYSRWYHEINGGNPFYSTKRKEWVCHPRHWRFRFRSSLEGTDELRQIRHKMTFLKLKRA
jgi:hypothetical protein